MTENKLIKNLEERLSKSADKTSTLMEAVGILSLSYFREINATGGTIPKEEAEYCIYLCGCLELGDMPEVAKSITDEYNGKTYLRNRVSFDLPEAPGLQAEIMSRVGKTNSLEVQVREMPTDGLSWTMTNKDLLIDGKYFGTLTYGKDNASKEVLKLKYLGFIPDLEMVSYDDITNKQETQQKLADGSIGRVQRELPYEMYEGSWTEAVLLETSRINKGPLVRVDAFTEGKLNLKLQ